MNRTFLNGNAIFPVLKAPPLKGESSLQLSRSRKYCPPLSELTRLGLPTLPSHHEIHQRHLPSEWYNLCLVWLMTVYKDGTVCISILHPPGDDPNHYESSSERWSPVQSVEKILLSVMSMLAEPNDESGANIDACVASYPRDYWRWVESLEEW